MNAPRIFDAKHYESYNTAREAVVRNTLSDISRQVTLRTGLDVGCGLGYFSSLLNSLGLHVTGVDGRQENVKEAARRIPHVSFHTGNIEDPRLPDMGRFDLVLCLGLLYHLENPFLAIRSLHSLTDKILFVESMCAPGTDPSMQLLDEFHAEDQGLNYVAFYPTESCLVKMLYRAGFPFVFALTTPPDHTDFHATKGRRKARTMLVASNSQLDTARLALLQELNRPWDIWSIPAKPWRLQLSRLANIGRKFATHLRPRSLGARKAK